MNPALRTDPEAGDRLTGHAVSFFGMTLVSRVFGYLRDAVIMVVFGAGGMTDAFLVAFRLPNFLRRLFAEGAFTQAFVPVLVEYKENRLHQMKDLVDSTAGTLALTLVGVTAVGILAAPVLVAVFAPGFIADTSRMELSEQMLRITFPYILFISLTSFASGILNAYGRFAVPAFTPALLNLSLIAAALWLAPYMQTPITALAWGVLIAGVLQLTLQAMALVRLGLLPKPKLGFRHDGVLRIMRLMSPAAFGASIVQVNLLIDTVIASFLTAGSISWLYISDRFVELPVGLFGVALATVILPRLSKQHAAGNVDRFCAVLSWGTSIGWLLALPCVVGLILLSEPILISLVQYREFTSEDTAMAVLSLVAYAAGVPAFILIKIFSTGFFSRQNMVTPVRIAVFAMLVNVVLNLVFVFLWSQLEWPGAHAGLALATSLSAWFNCIRLYQALSWEGCRVTLIPKLMLRTAIVAVAMGFILLWLLPESAVWNGYAPGWRLLLLGGFVGMGVAIYVSLLWLAGFRRHSLAVPVSNA